MTKLTPLVVIGIFIGLVSGCDSQDSHAQKNEYSSRCKRLTAECRSYLATGWPSASARNNFIAVLAGNDPWQSDPAVRESVVKSVLDELLRADLSFNGKCCWTYARRVSVYGDSISHVSCGLFSTGLDRRFVLNGFYACMKKFQEACHAIPNCGRMKNESTEAYMERINAASKTAGDYSYAMRIWELNMKCHLKSLPKEYQKEYLERSKPFLDFKSGRELRDEMRDLKEQ